MARKKAEVAGKRTEGEVFRMLRSHVVGADAGNGPSHVIVPSVRNAAGFSATRTIDAIGMSLWPSRGLLLTAYEIKCDRSDWVRELKNPEKAEDFCKLVDFFCVVTGERGIVREGELPPDWGLIEPYGAGMRTVSSPALLHPFDTPADRKRRPLPPGFSRGFLAALLREASRQGQATPEDIVAAEKKGYESGHKAALLHQRSYQDMYEALQAKVTEFQMASGLNIRSTRTTYGGHTPEELGAVVKAVMFGQAQTDGYVKQLERVADDAERIALNARQRLAEYGVRDAQG